MKYSAFSFNTTDTCKTVSFDNNGNSHQGPDITFHKGTVLVFPSDSVSYDIDAKAFDVFVAIDSRKNLSIPQQHYESERVG